MEKSQVSWYDLPHELWLLIGQYLDTYIDILRFRSVCRLWRNSLPKVNVIFPLSTPLNTDPNFCSDMDEFVLFRRIIYYFSPLDHHQSSNSECFFAMINSTNFNTRFQHPIYLINKPNNEGKKVNFLDFRIQEVAQSCLLGITNSHVTYIEKLVKILVFPNSEKLKKDKNINIVVELRQSSGWLFLMKFWESFKGQILIMKSLDDYDDVIVHESQIYVVDRQGKMFLINSSMKLVQISIPMSSLGDLKHLVECGGELYVVDRFVERNISEFDRLGFESMPKAVDFKVYRLDKERGRLVKVKNLGNHGFVLGVDCFSILAPTTGLGGFKRNCIYFLHEVNLFRCHEYNYTTYVFDLEKGTIRKSSISILKVAPPVWLDWKTITLANGNTSN